MNELVAGALELTALGLGIVVVFLSVLVVATSAMSSILGRFAPPDPPTTAPPRGRPAGVDPRLRRAVQLAIAQHRNRHP
jgi:oxaloacetate decarboxylase gamma subunit